MPSPQTPSQEGVAEEAVIALAKHRHRFLANYVLREQELALTEARQDLQAALPALREQWEREMRGRMLSDEALDAYIEAASGETPMGYRVEMAREGMEAALGAALTQQEVPK